MAKHPTAWGTLLLFALVATTAHAQAEKLLPTAARYLDVASLGSAAHNAGFKIARVFAPLCDEPPIMAFGPGTQTLAIRGGQTQWGRERREALVQQFGVQPGETVLVAEPANSPWAAAGLHKGDRWLAADLWPEEAPNVAPLDSSWGFPIGAKAWVKHTAALQARPQRTFKFTRGTTEMEATVRAVPVCRVPVQLLESAYAYVDTESAVISITLPLVQALDAHQLDMLMALEFARALQTRDERPGNRFPGGSLFDTLVSIAKNRELDRLPPPDAQLQKADRLAMFALQALDITPHEYLAFLKTMDAREAPFGAPRYSTLRGLSGPRLQALEAAAAKYAETGKVRSPTGVPLAKLKASVAAPAAALAAAPQGRFAAVEDVAAVPDISDKCRDRYRAWLTWASPKAFVIGPAGQCGFSTGTKPPKPDRPTDPTLRALHVCREVAGADCKVYAINDAVVWQVKR